MHSHRFTPCDLIALRGAPPASRSQPLAGSSTGERVARSARFALGLICLLVASPAHAEVMDFAPPACKASASDPLACRAPTIRIVDADYAYNRPGHPQLERSWLGGLRASVDPETPAMFVEMRSDVIAGRPVRQLVYRLQFEKIPLRFSRYFFEAHRNPGLMVLLTQDVETGDLLFVSTVHTCGCYYAIVPTDAVDPSWLPEDWPKEQVLYGQRLPGVVPADAAARGVRVTLQTQSHRVMAIETDFDRSDSEAQIELPLVPMTTLDALPIDGDDGETGSFFYKSGPLRGRVRGAWNPMEGLTAFGLLSLDPTVGMDKRFGDPERTGTRFYTLLPFWMHERSRLDQMDTLLRALHFRLPEP